MRLSTLAVCVGAGILCPLVALAAPLALEADTLDSFQRIEVSSLDALANHPGSALDAFSVDQLDSDRGQVTLAPNKPFTLSFNEPQSAFALTVSDSRAQAVLVLTLFRGEHETGRQVFAYQPIPGSRMATIVDGRLGISADVPFDRIELRRVDGASEADSLAVTSVLLAEPDNPALTALQSSGNTGALNCIIPLGVAYNLSFGASLVPSPIALATGRAAYVANLALKFCKPSLIAPDDIERRVPAGQCAIELAQPHMAFGYQDALGIPLNSQSDWGELGTPQKFHHNTDVDVMLFAGNPRPPSARFTDLDFLLSSASFDASDKIWEDCRDNGSVRFSQLDGAGPEYECPYAVGRRLSFPVGDTTVVWRANPRIGPVDLLDSFIPGVPPGAKTDPYKTVLINLWREVALIALDAQIDGWRLPNAQVDFQRIRVFDEVPPTITPLPGSEGNAVAELMGGVLHVTIEADEVGGVSRRRYENILRSFLNVSDACDRDTTLNVSFPTPALSSFWPVSTDTEDNAFFVTWTARDPGPNLAGNQNETVTTMRIQVLDRQPPTLIPPPDIVEIDSTQVTDLGQPALFDLVDLSPQVSNDAVLPLGLGLHEVTWTATDAAGNSSQAIQIVNIKASNIAPVALAQTGASRPAAISFEPTPIRLRGSDADGDPLRFKIEDVPENGFFVAPLYPYFIEDFRIEQSVSDAELVTLCAANGGSGWSFDLEFPSEPDFLTVTDDGRTYVVDKGLISCSSSTPPVALRQFRLAVFANDGTLLNRVSVEGLDLLDIVLDPIRERLFLTSRSGSGQAGLRAYNLDLELQVAYSVQNILNRATGLACLPQGLPQNGGGCNLLRTESAVVDDNGLIYALNNDGAILVFDGTPPPGFDCEITPNCSHPVTYVGVLTDNNFNGRGKELVLDAQGRLYASRNNRLYRYTPSYIAEDGLAYPGELEGWLGRCDIDLAPGDQAVCDVANHRTLGFSCTDEICQVDVSFNPEEQAICGGLNFGGVTSVGCRPGQFRGTPALDIAPDGTIYVADGGNARIQRFSTDGFFAGQARSTGTGSGFVIGDFGNPGNVAANSSRFYILDKARNLLHISLLTPFVEIGYDYADLVYQSTNQFACENSADCIDRFSFRVSDGVRDPLTGQPEVSAPAEVEVEVNRNFRAPFANPGISVVVLEDVPTAVPLDGSDPDPLDTLSFEIVEPPGKGSVIIEGQNATYVPNADAWGEDSFSFRVNDGVFESAAEVVTIEIIEINDAPIISVPSEVIEGGTGYLVQLDLAFRDPDPDENHSLVINWGDGTIEPEGGFDAEGNPTGPILAHGGTDSGRITAEHIYTAAGMKTIEVCITDRMQPGPGDVDIPTPGLSLTGCESFAASITDGIDLGLSAIASTDVALPGQFVSYQFRLENRQPQAGLGLTATGLELAIRLPQGFDPASISSPAACSRNQLLLFCSVQNLSPGQSSSLNVSAQVAAGTPPGLLLTTQAEAFLDQTPVRPQLTLLLTTPVSRPADFQVGAIGDALRDEADANPGDGICATAAGVCTLRAALDEASTSATPKVIALANGLYLLEDRVLFNGDITLIGNGPNKTRIHGGSLVSQGGNLRLENLTLSGGGLSKVDTDALIVRRVRFTDNNINAVLGGAVITFSSFLDIRDSTFDNNRSTDGASLMCFGCSGMIENVTVSGGVGGGLTFTGSGEVSLKHLTIVGNGGGFFGWSNPFGAALHVYDATNVTIANSVLADNYSTGNAVNCAVSSNASLISMGNNAFGDLTGCAISLLPSDQLLASAQLWPLAAGLDEMPVRRPRFDSPLIDAFNDSSCLPTDARGLPRPMDGNDDGIAACDIGAAERRTPALFRNGFEGVVASDAGG